MHMWALQKQGMLHCHLLIHAEIHIYILGKYWHNDKRRIKEDARGRHRKKRRRKDFFRTYLPLTLLQGFERLACERMLETERKLHILTPLLWPSRCVFIVLLMLGSTPSGLSEGPLGLVWPSLPHLVSNPLGVCWQLYRGFPRAPSVGRGFPYHISSLTLWKSAGNCIGGFRGPPWSGVAFPTTSRL